MIRYIGILLIAATTVLCGQEGVKMDLPELISETPWQGGICRKFKLNGQECRIVEPPLPQKEKLWCWIPEWPDAFPTRNGAKELLEMGYYIVHINVFGKFANEQALSEMKSFYDFLRQQGFASKAAFIGMSLGGLYSFRFAEKYPETAACIYVDAPACNLYRENRAKKVCEAYGVDNLEKLRNHPLDPVNNYRSMLNAKIPLLVIVGMADTLVDPKNNGLRMAEHWQHAGVPVQIIKRPCWGHHPHGLDNPMPIVRFIVENTLNKKGK